MPIIQTIDDAINQINLGTAWVRTNVKVGWDEPYKELVKERRILKKIRSTCGIRPTAALYGQSQCGKSHLSNLLLSVDGNPMQVVDRMNHCCYDFLSKLNPHGDGEATGVITRFTTQQQQDVSPEYPVHLKLMSVKDVVLMLCDGYFRDVINRPPFLKDNIDNLLNFLHDHKSDAPLQRYVSEDDIGDIEEYFHYFSQDSYSILSDTDFFGKLALLIEYLSENDVIMALNMLWNNDQPLSDLFRILFDTCKNLNFANDAFITFGDLINDQRKTLLDVTWLDYKDTDTMLNVRVKDYQGNFFVKQVPKAYLASICAEVVLEVHLPDAGADAADTNEKERCVRTVLANVDILDFPGARARGGITQTMGEDGQILRRGKVGYYFNRYSAERNINSLLFCLEPDNFDAKPMNVVLRAWVDNAIGNSAESRAIFLADMKVPPLFFVGSKFNMSLEDKQDDRLDNPQALVERWNKWFNVGLAHDVIGVPDKKNAHKESSRYMTASPALGVPDKKNAPNESNDYWWFEHWSTTTPSFDNCYLLRDFKYSKGIFDGWDTQGKEVARRAQPYPDFDRSLRNSFINHPFVRQHFRDASDRWDEAALPNCDGSLPIVRNLASIVDQLANAASSKNTRDLYESIGRVKAILASFFHDNDSEKALKNAIAAAGRIQAALDTAFGRDPYFFGRFMHTFTIPEYEVHKVFDDVFQQVGQVGNMGQYLHIYTHVPDLNPNNDFDKNLTILSRAYNFQNEEGCKNYFESQLHIDLEDLFRRCQFGLRSPSQVLAEKLSSFWFDQWLRVQQRDALSQLLGEASLIAMLDMLHALFVKFDVQHLVAQSIHRYVDVFGVNAQGLSEMIADVCTEMINRFVLSVGYDYYSHVDGFLQNLNDSACAHNLNLDFHFVNAPAQPMNVDSIAHAMSQMDNRAHFQQLLAQGDEHSIDQLAEFQPGFRQYCSWRDLIKVGFVITNDIPNYDVNANEQLGDILDSCSRLINNN